MTPTFQSARRPTSTAPCAISEWSTSSSSPARGTQHHRARPPDRPAAAQPSVVRPVAAVSELVLATCQFPVGDDTDRNLSWVKRQMSRAAQRGARVAHFPEGALSGYAGTDLTTFAGFA